MIPVTPASAGGAGIGSFNKANKNPTTKPVTRAKITSFMYVPPSYLIIPEKRPSTQREGLKQEDYIFSGADTPISFNEFCSVI